MCVRAADPVRRGESRPHGPRWWRRATDRCWSARRGWPCQALEPSVDRRAAQARDLHQVRDTGPGRDVAAPDPGPAVTPRTPDTTRTARRPRNPRRPSNARRAARTDATCRARSAPPTTPCTANDDVRRNAQRLLPSWCTRHTSETAPRLAKDSADVPYTQAVAEHSGCGGTLRLWRNTQAVADRCCQRHLLTVMY
jgi:hypothetical protein